MTFNPLTEAHPLRIDRIDTLVDDTTAETPTDFHRNPQLDGEQIAVGLANVTAALLKTNGGDGMITKDHLDQNCIGEVRVLEMLNTQVEWKSDNIVAD